MIQVIEKKNIDDVQAGNEEIYRDIILFDVKSFVWFVDQFYLFDEVLIYIAGQVFLHFRFFGFYSLICKKFFFFGSF